MTQKEDIIKVLKKIDIIDEWYTDMTGAEYRISNKRALELLEKLEEAE